MTWPAAIVAIAVVALVGGAAVGYGVWMWRRARDAELGAAVARAKTLDGQLDQARADDLAESKALSDDALVKKANDFAARLRADQEEARRRGRP